MIMNAMILRQLLVLLLLPLLLPIIRLFVELEINVDESNKDSRSGPAWFQPGPKLAQEFKIMANVYIYLSIYIHI
jgi:hypothetical protein